MMYIAWCRSSVWGAIPYIVSQAVDLSSRRNVRCGMKQSKRHLAPGRPHAKMRRPLTRMEDTKSGCPSCMAALTAEKNRRRTRVEISCVRAPSKHIVLQSACNAVARACTALNLWSSQASKSQPPNSFKIPFVVAGKTTLASFSLLLMVVLFVFDRGICEGDDECVGLLFLVCFAIVAMLLLSFSSRCLRDSRSALDNNSDMVCFASAFLSMCCCICNILLPMNRTLS